MDQVVRQELQHTPRTLSGKFSFPTEQAKNLQTVLHTSLHLYKQNRLEDALVVLQHPLTFVGPYKLMVTEALCQVHKNKAQLLRILRKLPPHRTSILEYLYLFKRQMFETLTERLNDLITPREEFCRLRYHDLIVAKLFMFTSTIRCKLGENRLALSSRLTALKACYHDFILTRNPRSRLLAIDNVFSLGRILCLMGDISRGALYYLFYSLSAPSFSEKSNSKRKQALNVLRRLGQSVDLVPKVIEQGPDTYAQAILAYCRAHKCPTNLVWLPNQTSSTFLEWILEMHKQDMGSDMWPWSGIRERKMVSQKLQFIYPKDYCALQLLYQESFALLREYDLEVLHIMNQMADIHRDAKRYDPELHLRRRLLQQGWIQKQLSRKGTDLMVSLADVARCHAHILHHRHGGKKHELASSILEITAVCPIGLELVSAYCTCCLHRYAQSSRWLCRYLEKCCADEEDEVSPLKEFVVTVLTLKNYI